MVKYDFRRIACEAARAAADKKAESIVVLDLRHHCDVADFVVIAGAGSSAQMRAVNDSIEKALEQFGLRALHRDGHASDRWVALDYGSLVIHVQRPDAREFYRLDHLWEGARNVHWEENGNAHPKPHRAKHKHA